MTDLTHLPALDELSFPPETYQRFVNHLNDAINEFMKRWQTRLSAMMAAATDDHACARALVDARVGLSQRLVLARLPNLPTEIRNQLEAQAESDIRSLQTQLERDATHVAEVSSVSNRPQREATLRLIRDNALTAVLDPNFSFDGTIQDAEVQRADRVAEERTESPATLLDDFVPRMPKRRIFNPDEQL